MHFICYLGAEISSVLPRLVRKMLNLILARRLSYKLSVQIQSDCLFLVSVSYWPDPEYALV